MKRLLALVVLLTPMFVFANDSGKIGIFAEREQRSGVGRYELSGFGAWYQSARFEDQRIGLGFSKTVVDQVSFEGSIGVVKSSEVHEQTWDMSGYTLNSQGKFVRVGLWYHFQ
jgi:hypothetical protein